MGEEAITSAVDALRLLAERGGLTLGNAAKAAGLTPKQLSNALERPASPTSQGVFEQIAIKTFKADSVAGMIAKANGPAEVDMTRLADDLEYLCENHIRKTDLAKSLPVSLTHLYETLASKKFSAEVMQRLPKAMLVDSIDDIHALADGYRKQEFPKADICSAARKLRAKRGRTEGLLKEDMHGLLDCSKSEYALIEKGDPVVSRITLNKLPQAHGYRNMREMMAAAQDLPEPDHRFHASKKTDTTISRVEVDPSLESWVALVARSRDKANFRE